MLKGTLITILVIGIFFTLIFISTPGVTGAAAVFLTFPSPLQFLLSYGLLIIACFAILVSAVYDLHEKKLQNERYRIESERQREEHEHNVKLLSLERPEQTGTETDA